MYEDYSRFTSYRDQIRYMPISSDSLSCSKLPVVQLSEFRSGKVLILQYFTLQIIQLLMSHLPALVWHQWSKSIKHVHVRLYRVPACRTSQERLKIFTYLSKRGHKNVGLLNIHFSTCHRCTNILTPTIGIISILATAWDCPIN